MLINLNIYSLAFSEKVYEQVIVYIEENIFLCLLVSILWSL